MRVSQHYRTCFLGPVRVVSSGLAGLLKLETVVHIRNRALTVKLKRYCKTSNKRLAS